MGFGVETIGNHDFKSMGNGKVSVSVNNGNLGACVVDEKTANALKEKYRTSSDTLELSIKETNKPQTENTSLWGKYKKWSYDRAKEFTQNNDIKKLLDSQGGINLILAQGPMHPYYNMAVLYNLCDVTSKNS